LILKDIINIIESAAPLKWQEEWDNSGLQVGERNAEIHSVLLTTDVTEAVVAEAIERGCDLIISHHPLLYKGLKSLTGSTPQERCVEQAIRHGIAIYSAHTSMDNYLEGVSGRMAKKLGVQNYRLLVTQTGEYGLGVIGRLPEPILFTDFLERVRTVFGAGYIRYTQPLQERVQTIAMCGGAGAEFAEAAIEQGAEVFLSADFKYHTMQALNGRIAAVDIDHWVSEHFTREIFAELIGKAVPTYIAASDSSPVKVYQAQN